MRKLSLILIAIFGLAACTMNEDVSRYANDPKKRSVTVDDHKIYVVPTGTHAYIAWGGEDDRDGRVQYRQKRAVELVSGCRVNKVTSQKTDDVLRATVKC